MTKEQEAIEKAKTILNEWQKIVDIKDETEREIEMTCYFEEMPFNTIKALLNYIDKLQETINELKLDQKLKGVEEEVLEEYREKIKSLKKEIEETAKRQMIAITDYWKDKIKAKIEELEEYETYLDENGYGIARVQNQDTIRVLKELLGDD